MPVIRPTRQARAFLVRRERSNGLVGARLDSQRIAGGPTMYFVAAVLLVLSGLFYAAGNHELGSFGADVCRYGGTFCDSPLYLLVAAGLAAVWGTFVSIR